MASTSDQERPGRRRVLQVGAGLAVTAWAAPTVLSMDAASAATVPPQAGGIFGSVSSCGHELDPDNAFEITAKGPGVGSAVASFPSGSYSIGSLPPGTYELTLHPSGNANLGEPDQIFSGVVVNAGSSTFFPMDYTENGC